MSWGGTREEGDAQREEINSRASFSKRRSLFSPTTQVPGGSNMRVTLDS